MAETGGWYRWVGEDLELQLRVQPRGRLDEFVEAQGDHYRVRLQAPPVEGKANAALCRFLAESFGVPLSRVELLGGAQSRHKRLLIRAPRQLPLPVPRP
jgi:uncharacterized protein (TIGR00251 family)